ncbi:glutamate-5-semialdehyde dehydrogenase [Domibacillus sp. DTU_2020_1001157_1_SI_ALB_TIR_016]|uniref:glutamate-5-semialdehyde dehydrogenase n=1 Tax=Domibacillus sp. DTU_2020_1001157_1_SI_ALB_TIR_016 TaxID=3077789 RepID=UPI0028E830B9|nr:glutamate-5-semialdehyde dehydrogenase [Domibacillus sp. DTU_2020_1001157_1_SI_ALB_TIR_016]WNS79315.1 glutamate-5-semialdehyde dehydrogenase [Domibacillus sp. DTU_2020_1001157_1_SI_ALB_TIR_016]
MSELLQKAALLKEASFDMAMKSTAEKDEALLLIADALIEQTPYILAANEQDMAAGREAGFTDSLLDRLQLTEERLTAIAEAVRQLTKLNDPIGETVESWTTEHGLEIQTVRVPLGVVGMVYEARPNVTVDAATLCLKAGNAVLLRGSTSALESNKALVSVMKKALEQSALSADAIQLLEDTSRSTAAQMFKLNEYLDVLIPRGGAGLIQSVIEQATVPVLETGVGNCHIFIDESAQKNMAIDIALNAKTHRPSVCNAAESLLVHRNWPYQRELFAALQGAGVEVRGDDNLTHSYEYIKEASEEDWGQEYLAMTLSAKLVDSTKEAVSHINRYGTKHSEAIVTDNEESADLFFRGIDAAVLYRNASTRFTDGEQFGYGAEIGISTQKLHARGPMGLTAITTVKSLVRGSGQIRQ